MSPAKQPIAENNIYTVILALAVGALLGTVLYVMMQCYLDYASIFRIAEMSR